MTHLFPILPLCLSSREKKQKKIKIFCFLSDTSTRNKLAELDVKTFVGAISRRLSFFQIIISRKSLCSAVLPQEKQATPSL